MIKLTKKFILIDGNALVHRAFHALPPLKAPNGMISNAVFGFASVLIKAVQDLKPDYMAAAFDLAAPTFRHEEYEEYKSHRKKAPNELYLQMPAVKKLLGGFGIPVYEKEGLEADDLIGALAKRKAKEKNLEVIILTGDLDTLQLVEDKKIMVYTLKKGVGDTVLYDEEAVKKRYGGLLPCQMTDYKGLKGDPSDNIPGVPGVGDKTAIALVKEFRNIEKMYDYLESDKFKPAKSVSEKLRQKLLEHKNQAIFSKHLATIVTDVEIDFNLHKIDWLNNLDVKKVEDIFREFDFSSLIGRFSGIKRLKQGGGLEGKTSSSGNGAKEVAGNIEFVKITSKNAREVLKNIQAAKKTAFIIDKEKYYFSYENGLIYEIYDINSVKMIMEDETIEKITHGAKKYLKILFKNGVRAKNIFDIEIAAYLIDPSRKDYSFEKVYFNEFQNMPKGGLSYYPAYFGDTKARIWGKMKNLNIVEIFEDIEMPLIPVLTEMELCGIKVKHEVIKELSSAVNKEINGLENKIYKRVGKQFNINSPRQMAEMLFEAPPAGLGLKGKVKKTSGGAKSTAAPELEKLIDEHPIVELILRYRELQKLKTTYIEPLPGFIENDGRVRTSFNQTGTATGRLASENPNLQNIPIKTELGRQFRQAFEADKGFLLVSFDYSQLELRIVAHMADDKMMIEAFNRGEDIHTRTAAEIFEVLPDKVTPSMRRQAKVINFGIIYGMGILGFARAAGVDRNRAREFITKYLNEFSGIAKYMEDAKEQVKEKGYVETLFGRRRQIPEVFTTIPEVIRQGERMAINTPIQGTGADIMKIAMVRVNDYLRKNYAGDEARILLQVHDELLCEVKRELVEDFSEKLKEIMESVAKLRVPLIVDVKSGLNWAEMENLTQKLPSKSNSSR